MIPPSAGRDFMKKIVIALALAAVGSAAGAQQAAPADAGGPRGAQLAALVASEAQQRTPIDLGPGGRMIRASAEGNMLVWVLEVEPARYDEARTDRIMAAGAFRQGFCESGARILFERGVTLRVDVTDGRRDAVSFPVISDCPAAQ
jgi:hypothetical protein